MSLDDWLKNGWLVEHKTSPKEIADLLDLADRDLHDCQNLALSSDWRFSIAYNAALQCATAVLAAAGYRTAKEAHHYRIIWSLKYTIQADEKLVIKFDAFRKKRNISEYDRAGTVSGKELEEMIALAQFLRESAENWIRSKFPSLLRLLKIYKK